MREHGAQLGRLSAATLAAIVALGGLAAAPARAADATSTTVASSVNPAPYGTLVSFTATVTSAAGTPTGTIQFAVDGSPLGGPVALAGGSASSPPIATLAVGTHAVTAAYAPDDPALLDPGSGSLAAGQVVVRAPVSLALSATPAEWEVSVPVVVRATVVPGAATAPGGPGVAIAATGTVDFSVDGGPAQAVAVSRGVAELPATALALGPHTITAVYSGDASFEGGSAASLTRSVAANLVNASGVGVTGSAIYPIKDAWLDTIAIRGIRNERLGVTIRIYSPADTLVLVRTIPASTGSYASTWNGRNPVGALLPAGTYRVVQTLVDPSTVPALAKSWTSRVVLSTKQMTWKTVTLNVVPGPRNYRFSSGEGVGASSSTSAGALVLAGASGAWPAVGYEFTLPAASTYRQVRFEVLGSASGSTAAVGLHRWSNGAAWGQVYGADFTRTAVTPSTVTWRGLVATNPAPFVTATRRVRGYVDGGGRLAGPFRLGLTGVRLVVVYGILR
jgi:hypothetical protein